MAVHPMEEWLAQKSKSWRLEYGLGAIGIFAVALLALVFTYWLVCAVLYFGFSWIVSFSLGGVMWVALGVMVLIFIGNALADRREVESLKVTTWDGGRPISVFVPYAGTISNINWFSSDTARSYVRIWVGIICTGPRLVGESYKFLMTGLRLASLDVPGCAAVLTALLAKDRRVPFTDLAEAVPKQSNIVEVLSQVQQIRGVMVLRSEPPGLTLLSDFREELLAAMPKSKKKKKAEPRREPEGDIEVS